MIIYFLETDEEDNRFFSEALGAHDVRTVDTLEEVAADAEIVSGFIYSRMNAQFVATHPNLRLVATRSTGYDHIDIEACQRGDVTVSIIPSYGDNTVAEHTFALILALSRRLRESMESHRGLHKGERFSYAAVRGFELKNKTLGVIGTGRVGLHTVRIAKAFGMDVIAYDLNPQLFMGEVLGFEYVPLDELYGRSDIITLHIPLLPDTVHLLNREAFLKCKRGVRIVNTARGGLIDTDALIEMLDTGVVSGAGLDVLEEERVLQKETVEIIGDQILNRLQSEQTAVTQPTCNLERVTELQRLMRNDDLISRSNVVFTPHVAFNSVEAIERINSTTVRNIEAFVAGEPINVAP